VSAETALAPLDAAVAVDAPVLLPFLRPLPAASVAVAVAELEAVAAEAVAAELVLETGVIWPSRIF